MVENTLFPARAGLKRTPEELHADDMACAVKNDHDCQSSPEQCHWLEEAAALALSRGMLVPVQFF